ncbi:hypothetical protein ACFQ2B_01645 [Streptomyces stramineus]
MVPARLRRRTAPPPLLGERTSHAEPLWHTTLDPTHHGWLADHVVTGSVLLPAAAFAEAALAAGHLHHQAPSASRT